MQKHRTGSMTVVLSLFAVIFIIGSTEGSGSCPLPSKIYSCSPKCVQDYECSNGKVCCPNSCHAKSCVELAAFGGSNSGKDKHSQSGAGIYCNNQKCSPFEVCKLDPTTKKNKCMRA